MCGVFEDFYGFSLYIFILIFCLKCAGRVFPLFEIATSSFEMKEVLFL